MSPVDELRTRRALRKLDQLARESPQAFDPDRLPATASELNVALGGRRVGRPPSDDPMEPLRSRLPRSLVAKLDVAAAKHG